MTSFADAFKEQEKEQLDLRRRDVESAIAHRERSQVQYDEDLKTRVRDVESAIQYRTDFSAVAKEQNQLFLRIAQALEAIAVLHIEKEVTKP